MTVSREDAARQGALLKATAAESPVRQVRYELGRRAKEWLNAAELMEAAEADGDDAVIELLGSCGVGMLAFAGDRGWCPVIRISWAGGTPSLHCEDPNGHDPRGVYLNALSAASPMVVRP